MAQAETIELRQTVLHGWHVEAGGRMVEFGGWEMPVQYPTGIVQEHLATRRAAGLFDVSHMGRYRVRGYDAEAFLMRALTNNVHALDPGQAQYTFIGNETGGAIDDAYLYRLAPEDFLLVVNAGNRDKDWDWLETLRSGDVEFTDESEDIGMIALQGPEASHVLERIVDSRDLPENKRNRLRTAKIDGNDVIIARTGYTGEAICFELFPPRDFTVSFWQMLVDAGALPVGLGARDSLRLEAGLPLYGHELGQDPEGNDIPIFANNLARFGVRQPGAGEYVGQAELEKQRDEYIHILRRELDLPIDDRVLSHIIQPIAAFEDRKPLRAGFKVFVNDVHVGYVTSGTSVPFSTFRGQGITAAPEVSHEMRPIGLALLRSDILYVADRPVTLEIEDTRGNRTTAELVERNLWPVAPYSRPYTGFRHVPEPPRTDLSELTELARKLRSETAENLKWRRPECINLIPSEQPTSSFVDSLMTADPAGRYNEHNRVKALGPEAPDVRYYKGTSFIMEKEEELCAALRTFFGCLNVEPRVVSGQMAKDTVYDALKQYRNRSRGGDPRPIGRVLVHDPNKGGHLTAQVAGALKNYVDLDPRTHRPAVEHFPFQKENPYRIDVEATKELIARTKPELIVFGRSVIIHTEPIREIAEFVHGEFGKDNPTRPIIHYDAAHVLGLLGPHFQDPFDEGADFVTGSTHKTFFGPQRGVVLGNFPSGSVFEPLWDYISSRTFPGHVSNHHLGTMLGLLGATYEMLAFKDDYPKQVVANSKAFARGMVENGMAVEGDPDYGYSETHQVLIRTARRRGEFISSLFEANNVITNPQAYWDDASFAVASGVRTGTQEMTRFGMKENDFAELATLVSDIAHNGESKPEGHWKPAVKAFRSRFSEMTYCLEC